MAIPYPSVDQAPLQQRQPGVDQAPLHQHRPGAMPGPAPSRPGNGTNQGLFAMLSRALAGQAQPRVPLQAPALVPGMPPPPPQAAPTPAPQDEQAMFEDNLLRVFKRLRQLVGGKLTRFEVLRTNRLVREFGQRGTDEEIEIVAQHLAKEFDMTPPSSVVE
jgi:hypothetical protein